MSFTDMKCNDFIQVLSQKDPVPGGGGASALVGAIGTALGNMVGSLTVGKEKYKDVESEILELMKQSGVLQQELLDMIDQDAKAFEPLAKAYGLPKSTEEEKNERARVMESALKDASLAPFHLMETICKAIDLVEQFSQKGSVIAISDAGVAAACLRSALKGASLNIYINTKSMNDRVFAEDMNQKADSLLHIYEQKAEDIFNAVLLRLK